MIANRLSRLAAAPENSAHPSVIHRHPGGRDRVERDQAPHPARGLQQHVLDRLAAHRVPDQREPVPAELVGQRDGVRRGLLHGEVARDIPAAAVAAQVHEHVGVRGRVEIVG